MCQTERILHLSSSVTISEAIFKPKPEEDDLKGQKDRQRGKGMQRSKRQEVMYENIRK